MLEHKSTVSYYKSIKLVTSLPLNKPIVILFRKIADKIDIDEAHCGGGGIIGGATFPPSLCPSRMRATCRLLGESVGGIRQNATPTRGHDRPTDRRAGRISQIRSAEANI